MYFSGLGFCEMTFSLPSSWYLVCWFFSIFVFFKPFHWLLFHGTTLSHWKLITSTTGEQSLFIQELLMAEGMRWAHHGSKSKSNSKVVSPKTHLPKWKQKHYLIAVDDLKDCITGAVSGSHRHHTHTLPYSYQHCLPLCNYGGHQQEWGG